MKLKAILTLAILAIALIACSPSGELQDQLDTAESRIAELEAELADAQSHMDDMDHDEMDHDMEDMDDMADEDMAEDMSGGMLVTENVIYGFGTGKIIIVDPASGTIVNEITDGLEDADWGDPVASPDGKYVFVNERTNAQVLVIDTAAQEIMQAIEVGGRPVHIYNPNHGDEIWTHSDEEGAFYVINIDSLEVTNVVVAALEDTGHGKLVYGEGMGDKAYATNTNDEAVFAIDMSTYEVTAVVTVCDIEDGEGGTHAKAYSNVSGHVYIECTRRAETAIIDPETDEVITYLEGKGQLFPFNNDEHIAVMDKGNSQVHVIEAASDTIIASIDVEGGADKIDFYEQDGVWYGFTANTLVPDSAVINFSEMTLVKRIAAGDISRPEGARFLHRGGTSGNGYVALPASGDGLVAIIDAAEQTLHAAVPLDGAVRVLFVGEH